MKPKWFRKMFSMLTVEDKIEQEILLLKQDIYTLEKTVLWNQATLRYSRDRLKFLRSGHERQNIAAPEQRVFELSAKRN